MFRRIGESILGTVSFVIVLVLGLILAMLSFFWYFIPKREREWRAIEAEEAAKRVAAIKAALAKAHEARTDETVKAVEVIEKKAEDRKSQDSVDIANEILKGA